MNFYIKNDGFCVKNGDSNANVKAKTSWSTAICNINADIFDLFDWKWRKNGELPLKNDDFCVEKWPFSFCNLRYYADTAPDEDGGRWPAEWSGQFSMEECWFPILKNPEFVLQNVDFVLQNVDFITKQGLLGKVWARQGVAPTWSRCARRKLSTRWDNMMSFAFENEDLCI